MEATINDFIHTSINSGKIKVHGDIQEFSENGVVFLDGTKENDIDIVVMATGYDVRYPFLDKDIIDSKGINKVRKFCLTPKDKMKMCF